jgi:hypothetical protein
MPVWHSSLFYLITLELKNLSKSVPVKKRRNWNLEGTLVKTVFHIN